MKRIIIALFFTMISIVAFSQAAKPTIMVYPSDNYCKSKGYVKVVDREGRMMEVPDIQRCLSEDNDMRTAIRAISHFMSENSFPLTDAEQALKEINDSDMIIEAASGKNGGSANEETPMEMLLRNAKPDILLSVEMNVIRRGPRMAVDFSLDAIDSYTNKRIDGLQNPEGSEGTNLAVLVQEGVLVTKDSFLSSLQRYFDDMFENGKEITVILQRMDSWDNDFETEYEYNGDDYELADIIKSWFNKNTVQKRFTLKTKTANKLEYTQVRIPIYTTDLDGEQMANSADDFGKKLARMIRKQAGGVKVGVVPRGLGSVILFVGEKVE